MIYIPVRIDKNYAYINGNYVYISGYQKDLEIEEEFDNLGIVFINSLSRKIYKEVELYLRQSFSQITSTEAFTDCVNSYKQSFAEFINKNSIYNIMENLEIKRRRYISNTKRENVSREEFINIFYSQHIEEMTGKISRKIIYDKSLWDSNEIIDIYCNNNLHFWEMINKHIPTYFNYIVAQYVDIQEIISRLQTNKTKIDIFTAVKEYNSIMDSIIQEARESTSHCKTIGVVTADGTNFSAKCEFEIQRDVYATDTDNTLIELKRISNTDRGFIILDSTDLNGFALIYRGKEIYKVDTDKLEQLEQLKKKLTELDVRFPKF